MFPLIILLDTNVLYHSQDYGIHIQSAVKQVIEKDYVIYVHVKVEEEIMGDLTKAGKRGRQAKLAIQLLNEFEIYEDPREYEGADQALLQTASRINGVIFTYDKALKKKCKGLRIPVVTNYTKGKVQLDGYID